MPTPKEALKKVPLFSDLTDEDMEVLSKASSTRKYDKNETIIHKHDEGDTFFSIKSGRVKIVLTDDEGKEIIVGIMSESDFFGELSLLDRQPRSATVVAMAATETISIRRDDFLSQIKDHPQIAIKLLSEIAGRLRKSNELVESLAFLDVCGRLARVLLDIASDQVEGELEDGAKITIAHSRTELANLIGTTRETLTRALKTLETMGYLVKDPDNKSLFTIKNFKGLHNRMG